MGHLGWSEGSGWDLLALAVGFVSNAVWLGTLRWAADSVVSDKECMLQPDCLRCPSPVT